MRENLGFALVVELVADKASWNVSRNHLSSLPRLATEETCMAMRDSGVDRHGMCWRMFFSPGQPHNVSCSGSVVLRF